VTAVKISRVSLLLLCFQCAAQGVVAHPGSDATLEYLSARIAAEPASQSLYRQRGIAYLHEGRYQSALSNLRYAATLGDPRSVDFHLGVVYFYMSNFTAARTALDSYLEYKPGHGGSLRYRARLQAALGDYTGALKDYQALLAVPDQVNPADYLVAAKLMVESQQYGVDAAIAALDQGMKHLGPIVQLQRRAIELELVQGRYDSAIFRQQSLVANASGGPFWQFEMGQLLMSAGKADLAYPHLANAEMQLAALRKTPARLTLSQELQALLAHWPGNQASAAGDAQKRIGVKQ